MSNTNNNQVYEASMAIQILPNLSDTNKKIQVIDKVIENIKSKNLNVVVCPFETVIEGTLKEMLEILEESIVIASSNGVSDLLTYVKIAYNNSNSGVLTIDEKTSKHK